MSALVVIAVIVLLTCVALLGAASPYRRRAIPALEPLSDPLEDRRLTLLISLRDLETARREGQVDEDEYARLRTGTEERMARVLRALDERGLPASSNGDGPIPAGRAARWSPARVIAVALVAVLALSVGLVPSLLRSVSNRSKPVDTIVGSSSIPFFKRQVQLHPHDPAAHLNLANRYLDDGHLQLAYDQFVAALALDPHNVEALAHIGLLTAFGGNAKSGLTYENRALAVDPTYPEAMFFKGWILLKYANKPAAAVTYLRGYLKASPYGSEGPTARNFLAEALRAAGSK